MDAGKATVIEATSRRELITLVFKSRRLTGGTELVPFGFFLCSPEEVVACRVRRPAHILGLGEEVQAEIDDAIEMLCAALCDEDRPEGTDANIVLSMTAGFGDIKVDRTAEFDLDEGGKTTLLVEEAQKLTRGFMTSWRSRCQDAQGMLEAFLASHQGEVETKEHKRGEAYMA